MGGVKRKVTVVLMAIAILLPNCPCEVLRLFGIEVNESIGSSAFNQNSAEFDIFSGSTFSLTCHCDEEDEAFNGPSVDVRESGITTHSDAYHLWSENDTFASHEATQSSRQRAPPDTQGCGIHILSRDFLCSYLI